jgi:hypothetical protein
MLVKSSKNPNYAAKGFTVPLLSDIGNRKASVNWAQAPLYCFRPAALICLVVTEAPSTTLVIEENSRRNHSIGFYSERFATSLSVAGDLVRGSIEQQPDAFVDADNKT